MHLSKYPVTSKNGNEYMVNVYERYSITYAEILQFVGRTKFRKRPIFRSVYGGNIDDIVFDAAKWNYNYIEIAKKTDRKL